MKYDYTLPIKAFGGNFGLKFTNFIKNCEKLEMLNFIQCVGVFTYFGHVFM